MTLGSNPRRPIAKYPFQIYKLGQSIPVNKDITDSIVKYVQTHPGAGSQEIFDALPNASKLGSVQNLAARLCRLGVLENRGGSANRYTPAKYYFALPEVSDYAQELADTLLSDIQQVPPRVRALVLASKLDELFEEQTPKD